MLNVDIYDIVRSLAVAIIISFVVIIVAGPTVIRWLKRLKLGQSVRDDGPKTHLSKQGTPTMGGLLMLLGLVVACAITRRAEQEFMLVAVIVTLGHGAIGFLDDYLKVVRKNPIGLRPWQKIFTQIFLAVGFAVYCYRSPLIGSQLFIPFLNQTVDLGFWIVPFLVFVMIAMTNSANLTDGLDGQLSMVSLVITATFGVIIVSMFLSGTAPLFAGRDVPLEYSENIKGLTVFAGALAGALLGFLRFNAFPARVIMGDTGSFAIGAALTALAVMTGTVMLLPIMAVILVATVMSDILQVGYFKLTHGKRLFKMAPLHHHFELLGVPETRISSMYAILTTLACVVTLLILG